MALLWLIYATFGLIVRSIFPLVTPILEDLKISYTRMGFILGSWQLTYILVALWIGTVIDKWGVRKTLFAGALIMGGSTLLRHFAYNFETMLLYVALFGAGGPMISISGPKTISEWFIGRSRGTAIGLYMTGPWIGGLIALSLTNSVVMPLTGDSWRLTFACYGIVTMMIGVLWISLAKESNLSSSADETGTIEVFRHLISVRNVQVLLIMALLSFTIGHGFSSWLPKILENGGFSAAKAGFAASIPIATGIPTLILIPRLTPPGLRGRFIALFALMTAVILLITVNVSGSLLVTGLLLLGFFNSAFMPLMLLILMDSPEVGTRYMGSAGGMFFCVAEIGGFTGPLIMGILFDITGTFLTGVAFLSVLCIAISIMTYFIRSL
ncbi:nitrate/nitrite transporter [Thermodesulfobacteriota bacterium]